MLSGIVHFQKNEFDSTLLEKQVWKMELSTDRVAEADVARLFAKEHPDMVACFARWNETIISLLETLGFHYIDVRSEYKLSEKKTVAGGSSEFEINYSSTGNVQLEREETLSMARTIGSVSRYWYDSIVPRDLVEKLYVAWIENSLWHGYAAEVITVRSQGTLAALTTLKVAGEVGYIDIIGVNPLFEKRGLGTLLIVLAIDFFQKRNITDIRVITGARNLAANRLYQKNGFIILDTSLIYHKHFNN